MKKFVVLMLACFIGSLSISMIGCGATKAKDAKGDKSAQEKAEKEMKDKVEKLQPKE